MTVNQEETMNLKRKKVSFTGEEMGKIKEICELYRMQPATWIRITVCENIGKIARQVEKNEFLPCKGYGDGKKESVDVGFPLKYIDEIVMLKKKTGVSYEMLIRMVILPEIDRKAKEIR